MMTRHATVVSICAVFVLVSLVAIVENGSVERSPAPMSSQSHAAFPTAKADLVSPFVDPQSGHEVKHSPSRVAELPPPGTRLRSSENTLWKLAENGNAAAATRLAAETSHCAELRYALQTAKYVTEPTDDAADNNIHDAAEAERAEEQIERTREHFAHANQFVTLCNGIGDEILDGRLFRYAVVAATLGDIRAATCVVEGVFIPGDSTPDSAIWDDYRAAAPVIAQQQLELGNVTMVQQLIEVYDPSVGSTYSFLEATNIQRAYTYVKLLARIATIDAQADIDTRVTYLAKQLSVEQRQAAEGDADQLYEKYFPGISATVDFRRHYALCGDGYL